MCGFLSAADVAILRLVEQNRGIIESDSFVGTATTMGGLGMPEISRFMGIIIAIFYNDHEPPHFRARYNKYKANIAIERIRVDYATSI